MRASPAKGGTKGFLAGNELTEGKPFWGVARPWSVGKSLPGGRDAESLKWGGGAKKVICYDQDHVRRFKKSWSGKS